MRIPERITDFIRRRRPYGLVLEMRVDAVPQEGLFTICFKGEPEIWIEGEELRNLDDGEVVSASKYSYIEAPDFGFITGVTMDGQRFKVYADPDEIIEGVVVREV